MITIWNVIFLTNLHNNSSEHGFIQSLGDDAFWRKFPNPFDEILVTKN